MRPRIIAGYAVALLGTACLTACGAGAGGIGAAAGNAKTVNAVLENQPFTRALTPYIPEFEKQTGITVNVQTYSEQQSRQKILITLQAHSPAMDVFMSLPSLEGEEYAKADYYQQLDSYVSDPKMTPASYQFSGFSKPLLDSERIDGHIIGIPINVEGPVIFYRTDLFKQYGISVPNTLSQLLADAKIIMTKSGGKIYPIAGRGIDSALPYTFGPFFHNEGLQWLSPSGQPNFGKPGAVQAISTYATLVGKYGPPGVVNNSFTQSSALFAQGKVAMELDSTNEILSVTAPGSSQVLGKIGVFNIPAGPGGSHPTVLNWGLSMSRYAAHKDAAWKFIQWATSPQMQLKLALSGIASPRAAVAQSPAYQATLKTPLQKQWQQALNTIIATGNPQVGPPTVNESQARLVIGDAVDRVMLGEENATTAAAQIQQGLLPLVSPGGA